MAYDKDNIFAKILREEIPCQKVYEDEFALAFRDIQPQAPVHVLVIPKGEYSDHNDFDSKASDAERLGFSQALGKVVKQEGIAETGYRLISNAGGDGGQEVPHYHVHILGGRPLGKMLAPE